MPNASARAASPEAKRIKSARTRNTTAAKRSLGLIEDAAAKHKAALEAGELPDGDFTAYVAKYDLALAALRLLAGLTDGTEPEAEPENAPAGPGFTPDDLGLLLQVLSQNGLVTEEAFTADPAQSPLARMARFAFPAEFAAGMVPTSLLNAANGSTPAPAAPPAPLTPAVPGPPVPQGGASGA